MSILFHHYKELKECISEVELIEAKVSCSKKKEWLTINGGEEEEKKQETCAATLEDYFVQNSTNYK